MKYQIKGKNISVTEAISATIQKKLSRMDRYFLINDEVDCRVVVSAHASIQKVEITIFLSQVTLRAEVSDQDLYAAIDLAIDKLEGQMRKLKTRMDRSNGRLSLGRNFDFEKIDNEPKEEDVVVRAKEISNILEKNNNTKKFVIESSQDTQKAIENDIRYTEVVSILRDIDINTMSPISAFEMLHDLINRVKKQ